MSPLISDLKLSPLAFINEAVMLDPKPVSGRPRAVTGCSDLHHLQRCSPIGTAVVLPRVGASISPCLWLPETCTGYNAGTLACLFLAQVKIALKEWLFQMNSKHLLDLVPFWIKFIKSFDGFDVACSLNCAVLILIKKRLSESRHFNIQNKDCISLQWKAFWHQERLFVSYNDHRHY